MRPNSDEQFEILKIEMSLIQGIFNKYDDLIFRNRNWFITIWVGAIGLAFTLKNPTLTNLSVLASGLYWFTEGLMRYQYWYKYVVRYRAIREWINESYSSAISVYDLTNHFGARAGLVERIRNSFFKLEPSLLGIILLSCAVVAQTMVPLGASSGA
ncbi:hypothetical protein [uncultured Alcanivorax sp.]|uniref:hypothetical protein n=1 Tax=uncultured Alcanivorax sp. TaxID=191215 RepID=UPI0032B1CFA5